MNVNLAMKKTFWSRSTEKLPHGQDRARGAALDLVVSVVAACRNMTRYQGMTPLKRLSASVRLLTPSFA